MVRFVAEAFHMNEGYNSTPFSHFPFAICWLNLNICEEVPICPKSCKENCVNLSKDSKTFLPIQRNKIGVVASETARGYIH